MLALSVNAYYELADGTIALATGWDPRERLVWYRTDDGGRPRATPDSAVGAWKPRPDLSDFPASTDPSLPYAFCLGWDAKRRSDLPPLLADPETAEAVSDAMREHGLALTEDEVAEVGRLAEVARLCRS